MVSSRMTSRAFLLMVNGGTFRHLGTSSVKKVPHRHAHRMAHGPPAISRISRSRPICEAACRAIGHPALSEHDKARQPRSQNCWRSAPVLHKVDGFAQRALGIRTAPSGTSRPGSTTRTATTSRSRGPSAHGSTPGPALRGHRCRPWTVPLRMERGATYVGHIRIPSPEGLPALTTRKIPELRHHDRQQEINYRSQRDAHRRAPHTLCTT